jgi:sporulation protein YlmC with PRC-barrel domain
MRGARRGGRIRVKQRPAFEVSVRAPLRIDKSWADGCKIVVRCERSVASAQSVSTLAFKGDLMMKRLAMGALVSICMLGAGATLAQVAGSTTTGVAVAEMQEVALGWSAKKQILGKTVYNENHETVGRVDDIIIAPDRSVSYLIVGAGAFVGLGRHDVAVSVDQIEERDGEIVLPGATKAVVKALPGFDYSKSAK